MSEFYIISHTGVKGRSGRYPWGSGDRPYQRLEQPKRGFSGYLQRRKQKKEEERLQEEAKRKTKLEANKDRVIRSGTAREASQYIGDLSIDELRSICTRLEWESKLSNYSKKEVKSNMEKVDKLMKGLKTMNEWGDISIDTYNLMASVYNSTSSGRRKPMTPIQKSGGGKKKNKGNNNQND